jgi:alpha-mannosidase
MRLYRADGREVRCQEEQPESLLPFNNWRRRISFVDDLPGVGVSRYFLKAFEIEAGPDMSSQEGGRARSGHVPLSGMLPSRLACRVDPRAGLVRSLRTASGVECLAGPLLEPLVVEDKGDAWGAGLGSYRKVVGRFRPAGRPAVVESGPVRTVMRSVLVRGASRVVVEAVSYPRWPVLEFRFRVTWNEERRRLKLRVPTPFGAASLLCEVPGGAIGRPPDGEEHVHGRWLVLEGESPRSGKRTSSGRRAAAIGVASCGQHGLDFKDGELRLSVLRSSAYCHERGFDLDASSVVGRGAPSGGPTAKFADIGVHELRLLVTAGPPASVKAMMPGLADHLAAPPAAYAHLPYAADVVPPAETLLALKPASVRLLACKRSWDGDGEALIVRLQEAVGLRTKAVIAIARCLVKHGNASPRDVAPQDRGHMPPVHVPLSFAPFEIKTLRFERDDTWREVALIEES